MNEMDIYPMSILKDGEIEIIACAPDRFQLLFQGWNVAKFEELMPAIDYMESEFK